MQELIDVLGSVRTHTTIPVPKVLAWSTDSTNPVGVEYIVMERVPGVQIFKKWTEMGDVDRLSIVKRLTQWEHELAEIPFPAFGSLYHKGSLSDRESIPLDPSVDPEGLFCVGPSCDSHWLMQHSPDVHYGPCKYCPFSSTDIRLIPYRENHRRLRRSSYQSFASQISTRFQGETTGLFK
jgi:hypothetical protein